MDGAHNTFASFGSGKSAQPFNTLDDYVCSVGNASSETIRKYIQEQG
jgi:REP element-mobilizing transposase RayT